LYSGTPVTFFGGKGYILAGIQGGFSHGSIYISTNNGVSWSDNGITWEKGDTSALGEQVNDFTSLSGNIFAGTNRGVFRSTDNGMNWASVNTGLPIPILPAGFQVMRLAAQGNALFAGTTSNGVFISNNDGDSWDAVNSGLSSLAIYGLTIIGTDVFAGAFPFTSDSIGGVFLYVNNEARWKAMNNGLTDHKVNIITSGGGYLFAGTNSGLFVSAKLGGSWAYDSIGTPPQAFAVIS
jgi:ligand-binding sensor domain-containing protein